MVDPRIRLKNRFLAVILAWMIPGAGHLYQGRKLKSAIYFCSIVGLWIMAMHLSEWKVMAAPFDPPGQAPGSKILILKFGAQSGIGLPAACSLVQRERLKDDENKRQRQIDGPFDAAAGGLIEFSDESHGDDGFATGTVHLQPGRGTFGPTITGTFSGESEEGEQTKLELTDATLSRPVDGYHRRAVTADITSDGDKIGEFTGSVPMPLGNWLFVPLDRSQELDLHDRLGKMHELATLLSVVAGLLNILAMFDAFGGPAYGYGDEEPVPMPVLTVTQKIKESPGTEAKASEETRAAIEEAKQHLQKAVDARQRAIADEQRAQERLAAAERDRQKAQETLKSAQAEEADATRQVDEAQRSHARSQTELKEAQQRVESIERELESIQESIAKQPDNASLAQELESRKRSLADEKQVLAANQRALDAARLELEQAQSRARTASARVQTARNNLTAVNDRVGVAQREVGEMSQARQRAENAEREADLALRRLTEQASRPPHEPAPVHS